jgi:DNA-binding NarL/FixJ family response regulator
MASQTTIASSTTTAADVAAGRPEYWPTSKPWLLDRRPRISVMVVDGQAVFRSGLARLLGEDDRLEVVAVSEGGPDVPELCAAMSIDVVVTDLRLPKIDGIEMIRMISASSPSTKTLVVAADADGGVVPAIGSGAAGFLLKDAQPEAIMSAVVAVHLGEQVLCRQAISWVNGNASFRRLTRRESEVLAMMAEGAGNKEIAERLNLEEKTVRNYVSRVYHKLSVHSRAQIAAYASHSEVSRDASTDDVRWTARGANPNPVEIP